MSTTKPIALSTSITSSLNESVSQQAAGHRCRGAIRLIESAGSLGWLARSSRGAIGSGDVEQTANREPRDRAGREGSSARREDRARTLDARSAVRAPRSAVRQSPAIASDAALVEASTSYR